MAPDTSYSVRISFGASPERLEELTDVVWDEIRALQAAGPSDSTILKIQEAQRRARETDLKQNGFWLGQLEASHRAGVDPREILTYQRLIDGLTRDTVRTAAARYLRLDNYVRVSLYPERPRP